MFLKIAKKEIRKKKESKVETKKIEKKEEVVKTETQISVESKTEEIKTTG
jgi:hypothetical protein